MIWRLLGNLIALAMAFAFFAFSAESLWARQLTTDYWVFHDAAGHPVAFAFTNGLVFVLTTDVPMWTQHPHVIDHFRLFTTDIYRYDVQALISHADLLVGETQSGDSGWFPDIHAKCLGLCIIKGSSVWGIPNARYAFATIPIWMIQISLAIYPVRRSLRFGIVRYRVVKRRRRGLCPVCAYDLRQSPTRCPECGYARTVISS